MSDMLRITFNKFTMLIRHGDLLICKVKSIPDNLQKKNDTILLEGEATNHFHRLSGGVVYEVEPTKDNGWNLGYFEIPNEADLTHEEHDTIKIKKGFYKFYSQREYDPQEERRVID